MPNTSNMIDHPRHYVSHPSGVETIELAEHMPFNIGNAFKYLSRAGLKGDRLVDLEKARWYLKREIQRLAKDLPLPSVQAGHWIGHEPDEVLRRLVFGLWMAVIGLGEFPSRKPNAAIARYVEKALLLIEELIQAEREARAGVVSLTPKRAGETLVP